MTCFSLQENGKQVACVLVSRYPRINAQSSHLIRSIKAAFWNIYIEVWLKQRYSILFMRRGNFILLRRSTIAWIIYLWAQQSWES